MTRTEKFDVANRFCLDKDYEEAIFIYRKLALEEEDYRMYYNGAICYIQLDKYKEAVPLLEKAIQLCPNQAMFYFNLSLCYYHTNQPKKSLVAANTAWALNPEIKGTQELIDNILGGWNI